jgi:hypothetical protein
MFWGMGFANALIMRLREVEGVVSRLTRSQRGAVRGRLPDVELMEWERRQAVRDEAARRRWETR